MRKLWLIATLTLAAGPVSAATITGEFWNADTPLGSNADALAVIDAGAPDATFMSSGIDYPNGATTVVKDDETSLADFLGVDAASIVGTGSDTMEFSVFRFTGFVELLAGPTTVTVASDDGFLLTLGDFQMEFDDERSFRTTSDSFDTPVTEVVPFTLIYWENLGRSGVEFSINDEIVQGFSADVPVVPLPASAGLLLIGAVAFGAFRMRR